MPYARTMAFTTLVLAQLFNAFNARSDERSAFSRLFTNRWLWLSIALSVVLQSVVLYLPSMQRAFGTVALDPMDWAKCMVAASAVFWIREANKVLTRGLSGRAIA
jgi:Ca2+-transporting ATPase